METKTKKLKRVIDGAVSTDLKGLAALQGRRGGKGHLLLELVQNGLDADDVTEVHVRLSRGPRSRMVKVEVEDDSPEGFKHLAHAYTLFAKSTKAEDATKRGIFNLGEKIVLACCTGGASIVTTKGTVEFDIQADQRIELPNCREAGSIFTGFIPMTKVEQAEAEDLVRSILPPMKTMLLLNGEEVPYRSPKARVDVKGLPCMIWRDKGDGTGDVVRSRRNTWLRVHEPRDGEKPTLFVLGLPLVELTGDRYHVDVGHRIPCDLERSEVPAGVLRQIRTAVLDRMHEEITEEDVHQTWVQESLETCSKEALETFLDRRFGTNRASNDPTDIEAGKRFVAQGGVVLGGRSLTKNVWKRVKEEELIKPTSHYTPGHKHAVSPEGPNTDYAREKWTSGMELIVTYSKVIGRELLGYEPHVRIVREIKGNYVACFGGRTLSFNVQRLGKKWFEQEVDSEKVNDLLIHEFAHDRVGDHLSDDFHSECCRLGAKLFRLALKKPEIWSETLASWRP